MEVKAKTEEEDSDRNRVKTRGKCSLACRNVFPHCVLPLTTWIWKGSLLRPEFLFPIGILTVVFTSDSSQAASSCHVANFAFEAVALTEAPHGNTCCVFFPPNTIKIKNHKRKKSLNFIRSLFLEIKHNHLQLPTQAYSYVSHKPRHPRQTRKGQKTGFLVK